MQYPLYADLRQTFLDKIRMTDLGIRPITTRLYRTRRPPATWPNLCFKQAYWGSSGTSKSSQSRRMKAMKTIYQDDLVTAQGVKTLGRRNAKPTANREVEEDYIQQPRTPPIENEAGGCGYQRGIAGMGVQRKQQANPRAI
ncbi:hypothetical protein PENSUB_9813 [Penicillium subrubescens]|uniref:Uncharacterized protein n=1 Tax=Penicillium subrubescens TaxID=1316194 RepID=A0A1Q5TCD6_9EURO|nr:hypothetical protein PENSUB_9813 [Penicillium subrubescens]